MTRRVLAVVVVLTCSLAGVVTGAQARRGHSDERLPDWVRIAGTAFAGQTADEVRPRLKGQMDALLARRLTLVVETSDGRRRMWTATRKALGLSVDAEGMLNDAFAAARAESLWGRLSRRFVQKDSVEIPIRRNVDRETLRTYLIRNVRDVVAVPSRSARMVLQAGRPVIVPDKAGVTLDLDASISAVADVLMTDAGDQVKLALKSVSPAVTAAEANGIVAEIARFETRYREKGNRRKNLELACAKINGTIVKPGGVFSYNETVGPRIAAAGFRMAPVIVQGRMEPGMGGGICQVSSTLYNAALLADLEVVRRRHHAFPVHYVPAGRDATVVYGAIDLRLRNASEHAVGILADGSNGKVVVRFFGTPQPGRSISIERTGIATWAAPVKTITDPTLPAGKTIVRDKGHAGHRVSVWRVVRENGRVVRRELISRDNYRAFPRVIVRGIGTAPPPSPQPARTDAAVSPVGRPLEPIVPRP